MSEALQSLEQQIQNIEQKIGKREEQTMQLMTIENKFQEYLNAYLYIFLVNAIVI